MTTNSFRRAAWAALCFVPLAIVLVGCQKEVVTKAPEGGASPGTSTDSALLGDGATGASGGSTAANGTAAPGSTAAPTGPGAKPGPSGSVATGGGAVTTTPGAYRLAFQFQPNTTFKYKTESESKMQMQMSKGKGEPIAQNVSLTTEYKVLKATGDSATIESRIVDLSMGDMAEAKGPAKEMFDRMRSEVTTTTFNSRGEATETASSEAGGRGRMGSIRSMMNLGSEVGFLGLVMPAGPVKVGDSWTSEYDIGKMVAGMMGGMGGSSPSVSNGIVKVSYRFKSVDPGKGTAVIDFSSKGAPSMKMPNPMAGQKGAKGMSADMPAEFAVTLTFDTGGTMTIDLKTGMPIEVRTTSNTSMAFPGMGGMGDNRQTVTSVARRL